MTFEFTPAEQLPGESKIVSVESFAPAPPGWFLYRELKDGEKRVPLPGWLTVVMEDGTRRVVAAMDYAGELVPVPELFTDGCYTDGPLKEQED